MSAGAALRRGQRAAEALMVDTLHIGRGSGEVDPFTGEPETVAVYEGAGKIQTFEPYETVLEVGGSSVVQQRYAVHVPVDAGPFRVGDVVEVVFSGNPNLAGTRYRVAGLNLKSFQTAQRLLVDTYPEVE